MAFSHSCSIRQLFLSALRHVPYCLSTFTCNPCRWLASCLLARDRPCCLRSTADTTGLERRQFQQAHKAAEMYAYKTAATQGESDEDSGMHLLSSDSGLPSFQLLMLVIFPLSMDCRLQPRANKHCAKQASTSASSQQMCKRAAHTSPLIGLWPLHDPVLQHQPARLPDQCRLSARTNSFTAAVFLALHTGTTSKCRSKPLRSSWWTRLMNSWYR